MIRPAAIADRKRAPPPALNQAAFGSVRADELVLLRVFASRFGLGRRAVRVLKARGLPHHRLGKSDVILGGELIEFVRQLPAGEPS